MLLGNARLQPGLLAQRRARLEPGVPIQHPDGTERLTLGGGLTLQNNAVLALSLDGTTAGTEHDQVAVTDGDVTLDGSASLAITLGYAPAVGDTFTILSNTTGNPVGGQFAGDSGATATFEGDVYVFSVDYTGGGGNDIVLQVVPTGTLILVR